MALAHYGRRRAELEYFAANDRILFATLPIAHVPTLYARIGDTGVAFAALFVLVLAARTRRARRA